MGEAFGHIVPGTFYTIIALILLFLTRQNREDAKLALTGSKQMRAALGWGCAITAATGIFLEGIGGVLHIGDFFFQIAHETMYFAFLVVGIVALLETRERLPANSWRVAMSMAFYVEGTVFFGHMLEQEGVERMLHFIMVVFSWTTATCYLIASIYPRNFAPHVIGTTGMLAKGIWFFVIADVLYSGKWGMDGANYMIAMGYTVAGILVIFLFSIVGCCLYARPSGYYNDDDIEASPNGVNYAKVVSPNDAS